MNILLPIAGKSLRFPNMRPKWLLTNPNGNLMLVDSISDFETDNIENIFVIYVREHEIKYKFKRGIIENFEKYNLHNKINFIELNDFTKDQVETIEYGLKNINKNIPILIKDCDNKFYFDISKLNKNYICYSLLNDNISAIGKSYITLDEFNIITNIVEKKIISNTFCCGGYFFKNSNDFLNFTFDADNRYISDIIFNMMLNNNHFEGIKVNDYVDWGDIKCWNEFRNKYHTIFIDLDGVLFKNSSVYLPPYIGESEPMVNNINFINKLNKNKIQIILTTSRPEKYRKKTEQQLSNNLIKYDYLLMGLQHSTRLIVNDFSNSNPYKTCESINIKRNDDSLEEYLNNLL